MDKKLLKLPLLAAASGIVLRFLTQFMMNIMMSEGGTWTDQMNTNMFYIRLLMSLALFVGIGLILKKTYDRKTMLKAATLLALFFIVVLFIEQSSVLMNGYFTLLYYLYLPTEIFSWITYAMFMLIGVENYSLLFAVPMILAPYLFMIFTMKPKPAIE